MLNLMTVQHPLTKGPILISMLRIREWERLNQALVDDYELAGQPWRLLGHVARGNPHWRYLQARPKALGTFFGPHAYLTPKIYPDLTRVPSWNYLAVHCQVETRLIDLPEDKDVLLKHLIADHEPGYAAQWRGLDEGYTQKMLTGIVAFEMQVTQLECKLKLNQHRPESHAKLHALYASGNDHERALADWMSRLGMVEPATDQND